MDTLTLGKQFVDALATHLTGVTSADPGGDAFIASVETALRHSPLSLNTHAAPKAARYPEWQQLTTMARRQSNATLVDTLIALEPHLAWIPGNHFWPEPGHAYFAEKMFGALIAGDEGSNFNCDQGYILLLHTMQPYSIYPLHEHRIPEGYCILGGHCEWTHDGVNWSVRPPGTLFYNESWEPHAIRSHEEPLLSIDLYLPPFGLGRRPCRFVDPVRR